MDRILDHLKESWKLILEEEEKEPSFCCMVYVDKKDEKPFTNMQKDLKLGGELVESGTFHATIRYAKCDKNYDAFIEYMDSLKLPTLHATCTNFAIYGKDKDTLVLELDSPELHAWFKKINKWLVDHDFPKSDFPTYKPHISLTEKVGIEKPEWDESYALDVTFSIHVVSNTYHEEVFRKKS